ncbi:hypothetical protein BO83DRAFT_377059 [Aspergillus eucalypticola CBS 122712]|uniref:Uncharacterized protein n=1 Tax=Aspergillus eucalypticola (strain CBS 122712 / IBT 29274) TaxID=1448314 RepID=A0A317VQK2_ASPEC|nr:uncharacterized protein BO83DRAFT_377059 [Aspergillus eucalypticola CBS 122712]PWY76586.1 hypothetical protein BO83DRAFT_377059 [Aspergillus eucalypticola CBS 122712]
MVMIKLFYFLPPSSWFPIRLEPLFMGNRKRVKPSIFQPKVARLSYFKNGKTAVSRPRNRRRPRPWKASKRRSRLPARPCDWIRYSVGPPLDEQRKNARIGENTTASEIRELGLSYGRRMLIGSGGPAQDSCVRESGVGDHSRLVTKGSMIDARNIKRTCEQVAVD